VGIAMGESEERAAQSWVGITNDMDKDGDKVVDKAEWVGFYTKTLSNAPLEAVTNKLNEMKEKMGSGLSAKEIPADKDVAAAVADAPKEEEKKEEAPAADAPKCCPPGSIGYAPPPADYVTKGEIISEPLDAYVVGAGDKAIILYPDIWGWNSGRVRAIADQLAEPGRTVIVPKVLQPALKGPDGEDGTDGDGVYPTFNPFEGTNFPDVLAPWLKEVSTHEKFKVVMDACVAFANSKASSVGIVGFCWGAWACAQTSAAYPEIKCAAVFHPSIGLEGLLGGDVNALVEKINCPFYIAAAGNDKPEEYGPDGSISKKLVEKFGADKTATTRFEEMAHGFVARGDIADEKIERDVVIAMSEAMKHIEANL